ncbi:hypothetical protein BC940DRAFT_290369 [Gongronella butleri]|nr:hypothetical protein BC940DRAFT_290369 [Gongronella butleri]
MAWGGNDGAVDRWIKQLGKNDPSLTSLHILSFRRITTDELGRLFKAISVNTSLQKLYCSGHALDPAAMEQLCEMLTLNDTLTFLSIGHATLGNDPSLFGPLCEGLAVNEGLRTLDLENKGLGDECLAKLFDALQQQSTIEHVYLTRNTVTAQPMPAMAQWLATSTTLKTLRLNMCDMDAATAAAMADALAAANVGAAASPMRELDVSENALMENAAMLATACCAAFPRLETFKLSHVCSPQDDDQVQLPPSAMDSPALEANLEADHAKKRHDASPFGNAIVQALTTQKPAHLTELWLNQNGIESHALQQIDNLPRLANVHLSNNRLDDDAAAHLTRSKTLASVELSNNAIAGLGLATLLHSTTLTHIGLFNNIVHDFANDPLPPFDDSSIHNLDLGGNGITVNDLEAIVQMLVNDGLPDLKLLELGGNAKDNDMDAWEALIEQLQKDRQYIKIIWKRLAQEMETAKPPI